MNLKVKTLYLSENQLKYFNKQSKRLGIKNSELIRRALDKYIENEQKYENEQNKNSQ